MTIIIKFIDDIEHKYNSFEEILKLDNYNDIIHINCSNNNLSSLPELPNSLTKLWCDNNNLSSLPELPNSFTHLYCGYNNLSYLPNLPNSLRIIWCYNNNISSLPKLPNSLRHFYYSTNPIYDHIYKYFGGNKTIYFEHQYNMKRKFVNKIGNWYLDCKYNPKYLYCRNRLMKEYKELYGK